MTKDAEKRANTVMIENNDIMILCRETVVVNAIIKNMRRVCDSLTIATNDSYNKIYRAIRAEVETMSNFNITAREQVLCDLEAYESKFFDLLVSNINDINGYRDNCPDRDILLGIMNQYNPGIVRSGKVVVSRVAKDSELRKSFAGIFDAVLIDDPVERLNMYKRIHEIHNKIIELDVKEQNGGIRNERNSNNQ